MGRLDDTPGCVNQIHLGGEGRRAEPTQVCSCPAGLIHMHDCPVTLGLQCVHFRHREGEPEAVSYPDYEQLHERLMQEFLSRSYFHRVRVLSPEGDPWQRRREHLLDEYRRSEPEEAAEPAEEEERDYERERERLIRKRKEREEVRRERDEKSREERAQERARMGIKTVVEKARETVAQQGNVMSSILDDVKLPGGGRKRRRPRRRGPGKPPEDGAPPKAGQGDAPGGKKRRRRRRRRKGNRPPDGGSA